MLTIALDRNAATPLQHQLCDALRGAILGGRLSPGSRLPPTRRLAGELGISRNTVTAAYEQLAAEGYLSGRAGAGSYVAPSLPDSPLAVRPQDAGAAPRGIGLSRRGRELAALAGAAQQRPLRPFAPGIPAVDAFPYPLWARILGQVWRRRAQTLAVETAPLGHLPLRRAIADHLAETRGVRCTAEQVTIVSGSQQALDLVARLLLDPGDAVWIEDPGHHGSRAAFLAAGARLVPVPVDGEGFDLDEARRRASASRIALVTPSHQFPLGITMSLTRRLRLLDWASTQDAWIIEDDYDGDFRFAGRPVPSLQGLDPSNRVLYLGTFSKAMFPSLRLGYLVVPPDLIDAVATLRSFADGGTTTVTQAAMARFIADGHFASHLRKMRQLYGERRGALLDALNKRTAGALVAQSNEAGLHVVARLRGGTATVMAARAAERHLVCQPIDGYYLEPPRVSGLVLGFAAFAPAALRGAVDDLATIIEELTDVPTA